MTMLPDLPILAGVDGSESALAAARWAALEAQGLRAPLRLVTVFGWVPAPELEDPFRPSSGAWDSLRDQAQQALDTAAAEARRAAPDVALTTELLVGAAADLIVSGSAHARLLVVGHRGAGGFGTLVLGSVGSAAAAHAACPVVVVRGESTPTDGPVVVGVDGSRLSEAALAFAIDAAVRRGTSLVAVHAWQDAANPRVAALIDWKAVAAEEAAVLAERLAGWQEKHPDLTIERRVVRDSPAHELTALSEEAQLVVVGSRGRGGFAGLLLGSVSQALLRHAACPVAVVRD
jgi:nucleotide-binding universal stress UspA family protein